jgi:hypothetical protein
MRTMRFPTFVTKIRQFVLQSRYFLISLILLLSISPVWALGQYGHSHPAHQFALESHASATLAS